MHGTWTKPGTPARDHGPTPSVDDNQWIRGHFHRTAASPWSFELVYLTDQALDPVTDRFGVVIRAS